MHYERVLCRRKGTSTGESWSTTGPDCSLCNDWVQSGQEPFLVMLKLDFSGHGLVIQHLSGSCVKTETKGECCCRLHRVHTRNNQSKPIQANPRQPKTTQPQHSHDKHDHNNHNNHSERFILRHGGGGMFKALERVSKLVLTARAVKKKNSWFLSRSVLSFCALLSIGLPVFRGREYVLGQSTHSARNQHERTYWGYSPCCAFLI